MDQHKCKKKNVFFRWKDPFEMHERRLTRFIKAIFTLLLFQVGENWVSKRNKSENGTLVQPGDSRRKGVGGG